MSLFPAYSGENTIGENEVGASKNPEWLNNSSYQQVSAYLRSGVEDDVWSDDSDEEPNDAKSQNHFDEEGCELSELNSQVTSKPSTQSKYKYEAKRRKSKKTDRIRKKKKQSYKTREENVYFEDKDRNKRFNTMETLEPAMRPRYKASRKRLGLGSRKYKKEGKFIRYHVTNLDIPKKLQKLACEIQSDYDNDNEAVEKIIQNKANPKHQSEQQAITEEFNQKLAENPQDVSVWLEYAAFQDQIAKLSPFYAERENLKRLCVEKKLSIVEKGLLVNQDSTDLVKTRLLLMSELLPADEFLSKVETMIEKDPKNITLWQALLTVVQTSCALCEVSRILEYYVKCFSILKKRSRNDPKFYDEQVLGLLFQCLTCMRHAGLWEQMWEIIRKNFCLNLSLDHETLRNVSSIDEKTLMNMEELVLTSKLPLDQLWLRIESLRERCHWTGIDPKQVDISLIGDEKRLVSADETMDFIYPTISRESDFYLVILSIHCLKIPLLPTRHCSLSDFNLENHPWTIDSLEYILPMIYPAINTAQVDSRFSNSSVILSLLEGNLISGPQFLKYHPAQEAYLDFVRSVFNTVATKLRTHQRTSILVWWLRLERLLVFISKHDPLRETNWNKKLRSMVKGFLKKPDNRNNLHFYREFALIELEIGSLDSCLQILKTIIESQDINSLSDEDKVALLNLYRTIFEVLLGLNTQENSHAQILQQVMEAFRDFISTSYEHSPTISVQEMLYNDILKFLMNSAVEEPSDTLFLPNVYCDTIICYAYLSQMKNSDDLNDILDLFDRCLTHCEGCIRLLERFYETKLVFLQFCQTKSSHNMKMSDIVASTARQALIKFPSNFYFLSVNALMESEMPCWKMKTRNSNLNSWSILANCLAGRARISYLKSIEYEEASSAIVNKMLFLHKTVAITKEVQGNPLIWRLYMLLLVENNLCEKKGEEIYYQAISQCPWARSVYISAAEIAPQILSQIQDLIREKGMRMHVTPEELDILRE